MTAIFGFINKWLFGPILNFFVTITGGNYALAIFLFTLVLNIVLIPLSVKSQKSAVSQLKIKPKLDELKKRCGDDKQKYNEGMQKLYQENNISMGGGCLPMIIRLILVMSVYYLVLSPLTYLHTGIEPESLNAVVQVIKDNGLARTNYEQLEVIKQALSANPNVKFSEAGVLPQLQTIGQEIKSFDFSFLGLSLAEKPEFTLNFSKTDIDYKLWIIPFLSFATAMFSSVLSIVHQKRSNPDAPSMTGMMLIMPLFSLVIAFNAPAGLGFYWACSSFIGALIQLFINNVFSPAKLVAKEQAGFIVKRATEEQKYIAGKNSAKLK